MTTVSKMGKMEIHSKEWFDAAFENQTCVSDGAKSAAIRICKAFNITGQADPGYIANVIEYEITHQNKVK